jgi:hypothetical protein
MKEWVLPVLKNKWNLAKQDEEIQKSEVILDEGYGQSTEKKWVWDLPAQ